MGAIYYKGEKYGAMPASAANLPYEAGSQDSTKDKIDGLNAANLPISSGSATNTKDYIDTGLSGKADTTSAVQIATFSFSKSVNANSESAFFATRTDFNLPVGAKVKDGYIRQNHNTNTYSYWAYALQVSESGTNAMQGAIYNPTASNRTYPVTAVVFYTL